MMLLLHIYVYHIIQFMVLNFDSFWILNFMVRLLLIINIVFFLAFICILYTFR